MLKSLLYLLLILATPVLHAQQPEEQTARKDVEYLTSRALMGRGYLHDGHIQAAVYICQRFESMGLDSFPGGYYQSFPMQANVFPEGAFLRINGVELELGRQFIPHEGSGSDDSQGDLRGIFAGSGLVIPQKEIDEYEGKSPWNKVAVIDEKVPGNITADTSINPRIIGLPGRIFVAGVIGSRAVIVLRDRLTHSVASWKFEVPVFSVVRGAMPDSITSISYTIKNRLDDIVARNVIGYIRGARQPDSLIVVCAHYDHLGAIGDSIYFPGANDNAGGVAMMLNIATHFRQHPPDYSMIFIAFAGEEAGLLGSEYLAEHPPFQFSKIRFLLNMDMVASGREGIMAVGGTVFEQEFEMLKNAAGKAGVVDVRKRELAPNSDHYPFTRKGVRGFYVYPFTGLQPYHHVDDRPETLEWDVFMRLRSIFLSFLADLQK